MEFSWECMGLKYGNVEVLDQPSSEDEKVEYDLDAVKDMLARIRGRAIHHSTFYRWLKEAGIESKGHGGRYSQKEYDDLKKICEFYKGMKR